MRFNCHPPTNWFERRSRSQYPFAFAERQFIEDAADQRWRMSKSEDPLSSWKFAGFRLARRRSARVGVDRLRPAIGRQERETPVPKRRSNFGFRAWNGLFRIPRNTGFRSGSGRDGRRENLYSLPEVRRRVRVVALGEEPGLRADIGHFGEPVGAERFSEARNSTCTRAVFCLGLDGGQIGPLALCIAW